MPRLVPGRTTALVLFVSVLLASAARAVEPDRLSPPIVWRTPGGGYAAPIHATLLPDGRILCIGSQRDAFDPAQATVVEPIAFVFEPPPLGQPVPKEIVVQPLQPNLEADPAIEPPLFVQDDLNCCGHTLDADGRFYTAGGTRFVWDVSNGATAGLGIPYGTISDGERWGRTKELASIGPTGMPGRWYPTCTPLPDGRVLVTGGFSMIDPVPMPFPSLEVFDPAKKTYQELSSLQATPFEIFNPDYTHVFVEPATTGPFDVLLLGEFGVPFLFSTAGAGWSGPGPQRPAAVTTPNFGASSLLLPLRLQDGAWGYANGSILVAGGEEGSLAGRSADVFDPHASSWGFHRDLASGRHHPSTVLLPDGRVLVVAGHGDPNDPSVRRPLYIDPAAGFTVEFGRSEDDVVRGYHTVTLLLPDGRVLVGGGQDGQTFQQDERADFRLLAPAYVAAARPAVLQAPDEMHRGVAVLIEVGGPPPAEVDLLALGSMTHSFDTSQRRVQVEVLFATPTPNGTWQLLLAPPDERAAPPGPYLLVVQDGQRVPSEGHVLLLK